MDNCGHHHTREHSTYHSTEEYTIKVRHVVCIECLMVMLSTIDRVVYVVYRRGSTELIGVYNQKARAEDQAQFQNALYAEAVMDPKWNWSY